MEAAAGRMIHRQGAGHAAVTFEAPHGTESRVLCDGEIVQFGRSAECPIRFAYAPLVDAGVPRVAGRLILAGGRVFVEASDAAGRPALEVVASGRPPVLLAAGDGFAPAESQFRIIVHGQSATWPLDVAAAARSTTSSSDAGEVPTARHSLELTDAQRRVIEAYIAPLQRGRLEPATHREVAERLGLHQNTAREVLYSVWSSLFSAGIPMPDVADKRVAVVEAIRLHRLL